MGRVGFVTALWLTLVSAAPVSAANDLGIDAFYGAWRGSAISESEVSVYFHVTARDIGITVKPAGEGRFELTTVTIKRKTGDPENPTEERDIRTTIFQAAENGVYWATDAGDPARGGAMRWARLDENALIISSFTVREDGKSELQTYRREITDRGMDLTYTRTVDGSLVRTVNGQLVRIE